MSEPKYNTCMHKIKVGQIAVFVGPGCPRATMIKGQLVSSKQRCETCRSWEGKTHEITANDLFRTGFNELGAGSSDNVICKR